MILRSGYRSVLLAVALLLAATGAPGRAAAPACFRVHAVAVPSLTGVLPYDQDYSEIDGTVAVDSATARAFVTDGFGTLTVLDTRTGRFLRTVRVPACDSCQLPVDTRRGRVLAIGTAGTASGPPVVLTGTVAVLDARRGTLLHTTRVPGVGLLLSALDGRNGRVFAYEYRNPATATPAAVAVVDSQTGQIVHTTPLSITGAPVVSERFDRVFVSSPRGLAVLDSTNGRLLRTLPAPTSGFQGVLAVDDATGGLYDGYLQGATDRVAIIALPNGRLLRTLTVTSVNLATTLPFRVSTLVPDAAAHRLVVILENQDGGRLIVVDPRSGRVLSNLGLAYEAAVAVDTQRGLIYVTTADASPRLGRPPSPSYLTAVAVGSGAVLGSITISVGAAAVAVDESTGTVLVLRAGGVDMLVPSTSGRCFKRQ